MSIGKKTVKRGNPPVYDGMRQTKRKLPGGVTEVEGPDGVVTKVKRAKRDTSDNTLGGWNRTIQEMNEKAREQGKLTAPVKPSVNEVSQAFHTLHADVRKAMTKMHRRGDREYHTSLNEIQADIDAAHAKLRAKLETWGMTDLIDWERED